MNTVRETPSKPQVLERSHWGLRRGLRCSRCIVDLGGQGGPIPNAEQAPPATLRQTTVESQGYLIDQTT